MSRQATARRWLLGLAAAALIAVAAGGSLAVAAVPDVTGAWTAAAGSPPWHLTASGPGLENLHATWSGAASAGHAALRGVFDGKLQGESYDGTFTVDEGATHVTGTMSFRIVSSTEITITLQPAGSTATQTIQLHGQAGASETPQARIDVVFSDGAGRTAPEAGNVTGLANQPRCPGGTVAAYVRGEIHAQITNVSGIKGTGYVDDEPRPTYCRTASIEFKVDDIAIDVVQPSHIIHATFRVHIISEGRHQPGQCAVGTTGTITATYNDTQAARNGMSESDEVKIGPWGGAGCNADLHLISDDASTLPAQTNGSTWVRATIACLGQNTGFSPRNCGA